MIRRSTDLRRTYLWRPSGHRSPVNIIATIANAMMQPIHPTAMPVILTGDDIDTWLNAPREIALQLQHPAPDGLLTIVAVGTRKDALPEALQTT